MNLRGDHRGRYGISMGVSPREPLNRLREVARSVERHGFETLWVIDFQLGMKDVYAALYVAALSSERLELGPGVTNLVTRHPTVTANAMSALDELSGGQAVLGLGAGWSAVYGAGRTPSRLSELREGIDALRALFSGDETLLDGAGVRLATARRQIPIYLAASQPGMLSLSGEKTDGTILMGAADRGFCEWQLERIYEGLERARRAREDLTVDLVVTMSVDEDAERAVADVRAWATSQAATFESWKRMPPGFDAFRADFAAAARAYQLVDHLSLTSGHKTVVSDEFVNAVAIAGDATTCVGRLRELTTLDVDRITFALLPGGRLRRLEELAERIIPRVDEEALA